MPYYFIILYHSFQCRFFRLQKYKFLAISENIANYLHKKLHPRQKVRPTAERSLNGLLSSRYADSHLQHPLRHHSAVRLNLHHINAAFQAADLALRVGGCCFSICLITSCLLLCFSQTSIIFEGALQTQNHKSGMATLV